MSSLPYMSTIPTTTSGDATTAAVQQQQQPGPPRKRRPKKKKPPPTAAVTTENTANPTAASAATARSTTISDGSHRKAPPPPPPTTTTTTTTAPTKNQIRNAKRKNQQRKKKEHEQQQQLEREQQKHAWWRDQLPSDSVDPITLESLQSLQYPPFALVASPPYIPMDWPPVNKLDVHNNESHVTGGLTEEERQRHILEAQWGNSLHNNNTEIDDMKRAPEIETTKRSQHRQHMNLFDGRALAYYMVSQLQFIDPLNRRDITRDELIHLDHYLRRHQFNELNVVEAYDTKGVTLSSAGATANTALGRTIILQQEAQILLNALFGGGGSNTASRLLPASTTTTGSSNNNTNRLIEQYEAHEAGHRRRQQDSSSTSRQRRNQAHNNTDNNLTTNVLNDMGMIIIDDDENPGLRGNASINPLYRHGSLIQRPVPEYEFPSLSATVQATTRTTEVAPPTAATSVAKTLPKAKTLSKISKLIKPTDPEEQQRQWHAREEARRKAMLANLMFGSNPTLPPSSETPHHLADGIPSQISTVNGPSIAQIERNRAFADALGVQPATVRSNTTGGWTRPTGRTFIYDEFGNELNYRYTNYPESLLRKARDDIRLDFLLKLEKKWKLFLNDDRAASLPLYPMNRSNRAFVHEYAEHWKLHTESFDPEPKRYVHCVKLRDTSAPHPLLSEARKDRPISDEMMNAMLDDALAFADELCPGDHSTNQTTGQSTTSSEQRPQQSREFPSDVQHQRVPLSLKPRSTVPHSSTVATLSGSTSIGGVPSRNATLIPNGPANRFVALADERERPKLELQKRTLPLELPPYTNIDNNASVAVDLNVVHLQQVERHQQKVQKKQEKEQRKIRALQSAFASDDEESGSDSEWEEKVAVYRSDSDEE